jgi:hypothetical protein
MMCSCPQTYAECSLLLGRLKITGALYILSAVIIKNSMNFSQSVCVGFVSSSEYNNSVALVRERTIPTERPPLVGEVSANFSG